MLLYSITASVVLCISDYTSAAILTVKVKQKYGLALQNGRG